MTDDSRAQLIKRLTVIQNTHAFAHVDILTVAGAMNNDQLEKYTCDKEREAAEYSPRPQHFVTET